jgi:hypothetical protein
MRRAGLALLVALLVSFAQDAPAAVARAVSFDEKVDGAEAIVLGRAIRKHSSLDPSGRWIVTYTTFQVSKTYKGSAGPEITVVTPGGSVPGLHQETIGVPRFSEGDLNVLFIRNNRLGPSVLYQDQGVYSVTDERGQQLVTPLQSDLVLIDPQTGMARSTSDEAARTLGEFEREVGRSLQRRAQR